jgi:hypothetical protein
MQYSLADKQYKVLEDQHQVMMKLQEAAERSKATETVMLERDFVLANYFLPPEL